jgi:hypothetical protein
MLKGYTVSRKERFAKSIEMPTDNAEGFKQVAKATEFSQYLRAVTAAGNSDSEDASNSSVSDAKAEPQNGGCV